MSPPLSQAEQEAVRAARQSAVLFALPGRAVLRVAGADRLRWLDGMLTNDLQALAARGPGSGGYALALSPQGRVLADLHVLVRGDEVWLELEECALHELHQRLERYVIADDVHLAEDREGSRFALEGPAAEELVAAASDTARFTAAPADDWCAVQLGGAQVTVASYAFSGERGLQLFVPCERAGAVREALLEAGARLGLVEGGAAALDCLRIEAGTPWLGRELDESVLPAEARLERAISETKGCYIGQEVVARLRSRGRRSHLLVGLQLAGPPAGEGVSLEQGGRAVGELTSVTCSPACGWIGLGFVRAELARPGEVLRAGEREARVCALPFVPLPPAGRRGERQAAGPGAAPRQRA